MGDTREERYNATAALLAPHGFRTGPAAPDGMRHLLPLVVHATPERCLAHAAGSVGGAPVELYEYEYSYTSEDSTSWYTETLAVVRHPWVVGGAGLTMDWPAWDQNAAFFRDVWGVVSFIPPFVFVKILTQFMVTTPDRTVGEPAFDHRYLVRAESEEAARRALQKPLVDFLLRMNFRGAIELRTGMVLFSLDKVRFTPEGAPQLLAWAQALVTEAFPPPSSGHPMR